MKYLAIIAIILLPTLAFAQQYTPLVGIPGVNPNTGFDAYVNALYALSIGVAALLAVIKILIAGVKWMMTDIVTSKSEAKKDIQGALLGLLIVLGAVLIITVINPDILKVDLSMKQATITAPKPGAGGSAAIAPYTVASGDRVIPIRGVTEAQRKSICETINPVTCGTGQTAACYLGTYYPPTTDGNGTCVVSADKLVQP